MQAPSLGSAALNLLAGGAERADLSDEWPEASWKTLIDAGAMRWSIPTAYGGNEWPQRRQLEGSEAIASACLTTAFILSQREAAIRHVLRGPEHLKAAYLPDLAAGKCFVTIGLSQLTTSRQHQAPSLRARREGGEFLLDGEIPWVTGASQARGIVIGATLDSGEQALFLLPTDSPGVEVAAPLPLSALLGSNTTSVHCREVRLTEKDLLAGPKERVLGAGGGGGLETSCLALGLTRAATEFLQSESTNRPELADVAEQLARDLAAHRERLFALTGEGNLDATLALRAECTLLALRAGQAALLFAKGKGFVRPHAAQRWARQAMFFLVWSCPRSVTEGVWRGIGNIGHR